MYKKGIDCIATLRVGAKIRMDANDKGASKFWNSMSLNLF